MGWEDRPCFHVCSELLREWVTGKNNDALHIIMKQALTDDDDDDSDADDDVSLGKLAFKISYIHTLS